jgi:hypothetical protein
MPITTGMVKIAPWGSIEWVTVRATETPDSYRVVYDTKELFKITATEQSDLVDKIEKGWRKEFPRVSKTPPSLGDGHPDVGPPFLAYKCLSRVTRHLGKSPRQDQAARRGHLHPPKQVHASAVSNTQTTDSEGLRAPVYEACTLKTPRPFSAHPKRLLPLRRTA